MLLVLSLVFHIAHFIKKLSGFSLKFKCAIITIIYLNSLIFPLTNNRWIELEKKQPAGQWAVWQGASIAKERMFVDCPCEVVWALPF